MVYKTLFRVCFELSTLYTVILLIVFLARRDHFIPLTYRSATYRWGDLQQVLRGSPLALDEPGLRDVLAGWCPSRTITAVRQTPASPQCACIRRYLDVRFANQSAAYSRGEGPGSLQALGELQAEGVVEACLRERTTWRKDTCAHFCQMHLGVPLLLACLCMSLFFSRAVEYGGSLKVIAKYLPMLLAFLVIVFNFVADALSAIFAVLAVLSALFEMYVSCSCAGGEQVYWSFQRFFIGSLAAWTAISHQGRDMYVLLSFTTLGFFVGMLAYTVFVTRFRQGCNERVRVATIYSWVGVCVISSCLALLVQQHWYPDSPMWSTPVSVVCLAFACAQCVAMAPGVWIADAVQLLTGFGILSVGTLTVIVDLLA